MQAPALSHLALRVGDRFQISSWDIDINYQTIYHSKFCNCHILVYSLRICHFVIIIISCYPYAVACFGVFFVISPRCTSSFKAVIARVCSCKCFKPLSMNTCLLALIDLSAPEVENTASSNSYVAKIRPYLNKYFVLFWEKERVVPPSARLNLWRA